LFHLPVNIEGNAKSFIHAAYDKKKRIGKVLKQNIANPQPNDKIQLWTFIISEVITFALSVSDANTNFILPG